MKRIIFKKGMLILIVILLLLSINTAIYAKSPGDALNDIAKIGGSKGGTEAAGTIKELGNDIIGVIQIVAVAVAFIMLAVMATKYMMASPGEKADLKKGLTIYVVGAVLTFASVGVVQLIKVFVEKI
jgi:PDZ domain-containing secreted protein